MGKMKVLTEAAIRRHYKDRGERIERTAMPEAKGRLHAENNEQMQKCLQILERDGYVEVMERGMDWSVEDYRSRLKFWREQKGMSQSQLAKASGVNVRMIQGYEQGLKDINKASVVTVMDLAKTLGVDIADIINER